jgi:transcriptional regulator with AAA-type ATPase domain
LDERKIKDLAQPGFVPKQENILFIGPPGVGKAHLAKIIRFLCESFEEGIDNILSSGL